VTLTLEQKRLVRESFPSIRGAAIPLALLFYGRLFQLDPKLRPMFKNDIRVQSQKLMDMLTAVVDSLDQFGELEPVLRAMGQRHTAYGVRPEHYETLASALLWAFGQGLGAEFYPDVKAAWLAVIEAVSVTMKAGAAELPPIPDPRQ
jgi:hemoglobin-like flavoprotein